jgi:hypothetical protein
MDMTNVTVSKQGKPILGDPEPGKYYRVNVPSGMDVKAAALEMKKKFPKSFFVFRAVTSHAEPAANPEAPRKPKATT